MASTSGRPVKCARKNNKYLADSDPRMHEDAFQRYETVKKSGREHRVLVEEAPEPEEVVAEDPGRSGTSIPSHTFEDFNMNAPDVPSADERQPPRPQKVS